MKLITLVFLKKIKIKIFSIFLHLNSFLLNSIKTNVFRLQSQHINQQIYRLWFKLDTTIILTAISRHIHSQVISIETKVFCHSRPTQDSHWIIYKVEIAIEQTKEVINKSVIYYPPGKGKEHLSYSWQGSVIIWWYNCV